ncbi:MAG TPA: porin [Vicinamibacterales bacterium]|nr:porin [Vicinamibacterales bacterium]
MRLVVCGALAIAGISAPRAVQAQAISVDSPASLGTTATDSDEADRVRLVFTNRPSLRVGDLLRVDFRLKLQGDVRTYDSAVSREDGFEMNRKRVGIQGRFLQYFEYEVERELRDENPWRDVFVNVSYFDDFQVRGGKFKMPFSLEELTGPTDLDFIYRTNVVDHLSPGRETGVALHGQFNKRAVGYEAGVFNGDGEDEDARLDRNHRVERTFAARVTGRPLRRARLPAHAGELIVGFAITGGDVPEGLSSLRGRTVFHESFVDPVYVQGRRLRLGLETDWQPGPFSVKGEFIRATDERKNQGVMQEDLPARVAQGWYVSSTWVMTGEAKYGGVDPRRPLFRGGLGALELAARYERLGFGSTFAGETDSTSPRGANLLETSDTAWTGGVNWYANRWIKVQANVIRERIEDANGNAILDRRSFWTRVLRLQFVL